MNESHLILAVAAALMILLAGCASEKNAAGAPTANNTSPQIIQPNRTVELPPASKPFTRGIVPDFNNANRICVLPVLFIPSDGYLPDSEIASSKQLLQQHMALAQGVYQKLLNTTFCLKNEILVYKSQNNNAYFTGTENTSDRILSELLDYDHADRYSSNTIYLTIYVRPPYNGNPRLLGGGRTINGPPDTGGGYVEMEYSSLVKETPYHFQSTAVHELGHAFGLTHVTCFGYSLTTSDSIMSYNPNHQTMGLVQVTDPGVFTPEEYFELSLNRRAFPDFNYSNSTYNPENQPLDLDAIQSCFLGPMGGGVGKYARFPAVGYELFFNGNLASGPGAGLYSLKQAQDNCRWNRENHPGITVECRYNGQQFYPSNG